MTHKWEYNKHVVLTPTGGATPSETFRLPINIPLYNLTVWAVSRETVTDVDISMLLNGVLMDGVAAVNIAGAQPANVIYKNAEVATPVSSNKDGQHEFNVEVKVDNKSAVAGVNLTIYAVGFAFTA